MSVRTALYAWCETLERCPSFVSRFDLTPNTLCGELVVLDLPAREVGRCFLATLDRFFNFWQGIDACIAKLTTIWPFACKHLRIGAVRCCRAQHGVRKFGGIERAVEQNEALAQTHNQ